MIPQYNEMYNEVLQVLNKHHQLRVRDMVDEVSDVLHLTEDERNQKMENSHKTVIYHRLGWTKTYLTKAGLIRSVERGVYQITPQGENILSSHIRVDDDYLMQYEEVRQFVNRHNEQPENQTKPKESTPLENIDQSIKMISSRVSDELLDMIISKDPAFFEKLVLDLLDKMGYAYDKESIISTDYSGDEGIDGIINEDQFGFNSIYIQAKKWNRSSVGRPEIQKFLGAVAGQGGTKGLFITTSTFTREAIDYAKKQLQVKLILVDGKMLTDLMMKYNLGVSVVQTYEIKQLDLDYFDSELV
ncbi:restriction endonuclease [Massilimicrobiota timonensis]|jgi:restriction system protein|uniref:Restriction endonuclease n=1 Tax=Massilimicrobiota timonensis TaxID=1776392 RepID=A0ABT7UJ79_9FIRM|nr:restriction endonuclease [Massilimicrobiota timonensis]MDM8196207.1 restriction endonuclease [Massilimicrobiota timonensis]